MMRPHVIAIVLAAAVACPLAAAGEDQRRSPVAVQQDPGRPHSFEISVGGELLTSQTLGTAAATMTRNAQSGGTYPYFSVAGTRATSPAFTGRIGYNITRMFTVEGGFLASRGNVEGSITGDAENAAALTVTERMSQYFVDVSLLAHLRGSRSTGAVAPFVEGGAGYLRQMHEGNIATTSGQIYHFGGGVTYMFARRPGKLTGLGIRAAARVYLPRKGYSFDNSQSAFLGAGAALLLAF